MGNAYIVRIDEDGAAEIQLLDPHLIHVVEWTAEGQWEHIQFPEEEIENEEQMEQELEEAIEQETTSEKRNGELSHENFELKKRIAELEQKNIVRCSECIYYTTGKQTFEELANSEKRNGELSHDNFKLKKRIAELEEIDIVHCSECRHAEELMTGKWCCDISSLCQRGTFFCADGERKEVE